MTTIKALLDDLLNTPSLSLGEVMDAHLSYGYRQRTDGHWDDRVGVAAHFAYLRDVVERAEVTVLEEVVDGSVYAERHLVRITKRGGGTLTQEVMAFGRLDDDGRLIRIEETTMMLEGEEADRAIGSARGDA